MIGRRLVSGVLNETCPYCFERFRLSNAPFRCASPASICAPEVDTVMAAGEWRDSRPVGRVLPPAKGLARRVRCSECKHLSDRRLCPTCHMDLPPTTGESKNLIFAVIGAKEAGKSHFIAVLIHQLREHFGPNLDFDLQPLNEHTRNRYREEFYAPIYRRKETIKVTRSALDDTSVRFPLIYGLTFSGQSRFGGGRRIRRAVTLVFFDTAGEDLKNIDTMKAVNRYIYRSHGIILLLDPLQLGYVRDQLQATTPLPDENTDTNDIINRVSDLIRAGRDLGQKKMIGTPLALAFSKLDAVQPLIDDHFQINAEPDHDTGFDYDDFEAVSGEMEALVKEWQGRGLLNQVHSRFQHTGFFGLSALGCNPHGSDRVPRVVPQRIGDPFLWLLHRHGFLARQRSTG